MKSIKKLDNKVNKYIVPLGVEKHLKRWKVKKDKIKNMAWWEEIQIDGLPRKVVEKLSIKISKRTSKRISFSY